MKGEKQKLYVFLRRMNDADGYRIILLILIPCKNLEETLKESLIRDTDVSRKWENCNKNSQRVD